MANYPTTPEERFGQLLRRQRLHKHLRQRDLAAETGISPSTLCMLETQRLRRLPPRPVLERMAAALDLSVNDLLNWAGFQANDTK